jgi:glutamate---cysteine ligase / carboxylate-amine ligase
MAGAAARMTRGPRECMSDYTIGIEEEYQLVHPATGELQSSGRAVRATDWSGEIRKELQESTIEVGTGVCGTSVDALTELKRLRMQAATAAAAEELEIAAAGVHPYSSWRAQQRTKDERYDRMAEEYGRIARDEHNFGMHVHVAPPAGTDRMVLANRVRGYIPHLLALSCSSPFFEGEDSGFASYRMVLWRRWPGAGPPPRLADEAAYQRYIRLLLRTGVLHDERSVYWMVRLHPEYPTLEFRMCDVCPRVDDAAAIGGMVRVLVAAAAEGALGDDGNAGLPESARDALLADDCWRVTRHGLAARLVNASLPDGWECVADAVARLLDVLRPTAEVLGEGDALAGVARILARGNGADRMRAELRRGGGLRDVVRWTVCETMTGVGLDRRARQRAAVQ